MPRLEFVNAMPAMQDAFCTRSRASPLAGVVVQLFQVREDQLCGFLCQRIGKVGGIGGNVGFQCVDQHVHTRVRDDGGGHMLNADGIQQRHVRGDELVDQDVLAALGRDHGEVRHFRAVPLVDGIAIKQGFSNFCPAAFWRCHTK